MAQGPSIWLFMDDVTSTPPKLYVLSTPLRWTMTAVLVTLLLFT